VSGKNDEPRTGCTLTWLSGPCCWARLLCWPPLAAVPLLHCAAQRRHTAQKQVVRKG